MNRDWLDYQMHLAGKAEPKPENFDFMVCVIRHLGNSATHSELHREGFTRFDIDAAIKSGIIKESPNKVLFLEK